MGAITFKSIADFSDKLKMLKTSIVDSPESPSSADLANWPGQPSEQEARAPKVLEWKTLPSNNGDEPQKIPYRWLCGRDKHGEPTNPDGVEESVQFIPAIKDKATQSQYEWQGALRDHPIVADQRDWEMSEWLNFKEEAMQEAKNANETQICESDALPADGAAVQQP